MTDDKELDADFWQLITKAAKSEGLTVHEYCLKWGIVDQAKMRQIRRHERPMND